MIIPKARTSIFFSIFLMVVGCTPSTLEISIKIPSFREYYPILLKEAQQWRTDAYLHDARIFLFPRSSDSYHISASFYSASEDSQSLAVDVLQDGTITSELFIHEYPVYHHEPITESDLKIDSQDALQSLLEDVSQRSLSPDKNAGSFIILERALAAENQPVIWFLSIWDESQDAQRLYLDANSGRILDTTEVNAKPTRFPTSPP